MIMPVKSSSAERRIARLALIAGLLLFAPACSDDPVATGELCIEFNAADRPEADTVTSRLGDGAACAAVTIEIVATDVDDIFAFDSLVTYDPSVVSFAGYSAVGSVLEKDGADVAVVVQELQLGELTIGASRVSETSVDAVGTELLLQLFFTQWTAQADSGTITLEEPCLLGNGTPPPAKQDVACSGGTIRVR
jgi:hypothetical protein